MVWSEILHMKIDEHTSFEICFDDRERLFVLRERVDGSTATEFVFHDGDSVDVTDLAEIKGDLRMMFVAGLFSAIRITGARML